MTSEQRHYIITRMIAGKTEPYTIPQLPEPNPDDFYCGRGEEWLAETLAEMERREREGADTDTAAQLDDSGFGSFGPM